MYLPLIQSITQSGFSHPRTALEGVGLHVCTRSHLHSTPPKSPPYSGDKNPVFLLFVLCAFLICIIRSLSETFSDSWRFCDNKAKSQRTQIPIPLSLPSCVTLHKSLDLSVPILFSLSWLTGLCSSVWLLWLDPWVLRFQ